MKKQTYRCPQCFKDCDEEPKLVKVSCGEHVVIVGPMCKSCGKIHTKLIAARWN